MVPLLPRATEVDNQTRAKLNGAPPSKTSDDDDKKKKKRDKEATGFIGLCLAAGRRKSFYTMAGEANGARASPGVHA